MSLLIFFIRCLWTRNKRVTCLLWDVLVILGRVTSLQVYGYTVLTGKQQKQRGIIWSSFFTLYLRLKKSLSNILVDVCMLACTHYSNLVFYSSTSLDTLGIKFYSVFFFFSIFLCISLCVIIRYVSTRKTRFRDFSEVLDYGLRRTVVHCHWRFKHEVIDFIIIHSSILFLVV